jgi:hypothetical protein
MYFKDTTTSLKYLHSLYEYIMKFFFSNFDLTSIVLIKLREHNTNITHNANFVTLKEEKNNLQMAAKLKSHIA